MTKLVLGRILSTLGLVIMVLGIVFTLVTQHETLAFMAHWATFSLGGIFFGAMVWLFGALLAGKKSLKDEERWLKIDGK